LLVVEVLGYKGGALFDVLTSAGRLRRRPVSTLARRNSAPETRNATRAKNVLTDKFSRFLIRQALISHFRGEDDYA
jgi:hypothetical protein